MPMQRRVLGLGALAVILDGLDNQMLGFVIPALVAAWGVDKAAFVPVLAGSLIFMSIGTAAAGKVGDSIGRRPALIASVVLFGTMTLASSAAQGMVSLAVLRCAAALGLGGAMPNATALVAEYTPTRHRSTAVALSIVCVPAGGLLGGVLVAVVLPGPGWRWLLAMGGMLPLAAAVLFAWLLPESPRFTADRARQGGGSIDVTAVAYPDGEHGPGRRATILSAGMRRDTVSLWVAFFCCLLAVYTMFSWAPTMLTRAGFGLATASSGLAVFNLGGIIGAIAGAFAMDRLGSRRPMVGAAALGALTSATGGWVVASGSGGLVIALLGIQGAFVAGTQTMLFALAAAIYPAETRATGVGTALAIGRLGAVISSVAGAALLAVGSGALLTFVGVGMAVTAVALMFVRGHVATRARSTLR